MPVVPVSVSVVPVPVPVVPVPVPVVPVPVLPAVPLRQNPPHLEDDAGGGEELL